MQEIHAGSTMFMQVFTVKSGEEHCLVWLVHVRSSDQFCHMPDLAR